MAEEKRKASIIMLDGTNYPAWKFQARMTLIREGSWGIVTGEEASQNPETEAEPYKKYMERRDKALTTIGLLHCFTWLTIPWTPQLSERH